MEGAWGHLVRGPTCAWSPEDNAPCVTVTCPMQCLPCSPAFDQSHSTGRAPGLLASLLPPSSSHLLSPP